MPSRSPWLNQIEPKWMHGKQRLVELARLLTAEELEARVYAALVAEPVARLATPQSVA